MICGRGQCDLWVGPVCLGGEGCWEPGTHAKEEAQLGVSVRNMTGLSVSDAA